MSQTACKRVISALVGSLLLCAGNVAAQSVEKEHVAVLELGGAAFWNVKDGSSSFGPSVAVEVTPIENWLELEVGTTALFRRHSTEWGTDLVFKKPWDLSPKVEFMLGLGPEWVHAKQYGVTTNSISIQAVADFMFRHSAKRSLAGKATLVSNAYRPLYRLQSLTVAYSRVNAK